MKTITMMSALAASAVAVPNVVSIPAIYPGTCTAWPSWINSRGNDVTGSTMIQLSNSDEPLLENFPLQRAPLPWGGETLETLGATLWSASASSGARTYYRCIDGQAVLGTGGSTARISKDMRNARLLVDADKDATYTPELYYLEVDGKRLDGVYLGAQNKTTWGVRYQQGSCGADGTANGDFFEVKLLDLPVDETYPPTAGYDPEFQSFLKVVSWP